MTSPRGTTLLVFILLSLFAWIGGRGTFQSEGPPAFFVEPQGEVWVKFREGFPSQGIHQISDGSSIRSVIKVTGLPLAFDIVGDPCLDFPLQAGATLDIRVVEGEIVAVKRGWMSATERIALNIPLHPERMTLEDWEALPGIGESLARRIEEDRQKNGDFGALEGVKRVKGVGPKRLERWKMYF
ncbi:MAG: hypothetical protein C0617_10835 [Desulfuromonas sp.]|uniref:ComEA family DNA-binding protein n=1 Tax=Desulfuromonas sp. TaxID=892 RepID=UPI000CC806BF|nr:helix-hairpin-helix domain-containing protein [Desulfuromonas sp.]PLX83624.1 MAG: hypothetical protein C0617_10835 [Desulfuromonas sp.]